MPIDPELREAAKVSKAWPYEEARKLLKRYPDGPPAGQSIVFETGYGPSGLPHLGTFQEVARTLMVRHALTELVDWPTRLIAFSDDMDGMRKVPPGVPKQDMMHQHLDQPLSAVPDPYGCGHDSYAAHNNNMLRDFLDRFGFDYEFLASSDCYRSGRFDDALRSVLRHYDAIMAVMLPTLGEERRKTYSPVLPISRKSGKVLQVAVEVLDPEAGLVAYEDEGERVEQSILSGGAKLQWKVDWALRWVALGVDYEMAGKDLIDSVVQSSKIARVLGARPPEGFNYELFLDENGEKISKTKGNGVTIDEWLTYAPEESLAFYIYREPKRAKQLSFGVIPKAVDEYYQFLAAYPGQEVDKRLGNPVHHIHAGNVPEIVIPITFSLLLNIVSAAGTSDRNVIWRMVESHLHRTQKSFEALRSAGVISNLVNYAVQYFLDFVEPTIHRRPPSLDETVPLREVLTYLKRAHAATAAEIQNKIYAIGNKYYPQDLRSWFIVLYETLLGSSSGPRMGNFISWYGRDNTIKLLEEALEVSAPRRDELELSIINGCREGLEKVFHWSGDGRWLDEIGANNALQIFIANAISSNRSLDALIHVSPSISAITNRKHRDSRRVDLGLVKRSITDRYYCVIEIKGFRKSPRLELSKMIDAMTWSSTVRYAYLVSYVQSSRRGPSLDYLIESTKEELIDCTHNFLSQSGFDLEYVFEAQEGLGPERAAVLITRVRRRPIRG